MKAFISFLFATTYLFSINNGQAPEYTYRDCVVSNLKTEYQKSINELVVPLYKAVAERSNINFVFAPHSVWIMLAAIAEGSNEETKQQLFKLLKLPEDLCVRQKFYQIATTRANVDNDINVVHTRALLIDDRLTINPKWLDFVSKNSLLDVVTAPMKTNPVVTGNEIRRVMVANAPRLNLTGYSVMLDTIDYNGLWTTAFIDAEIERSPFYSQEGIQIGTVDLMKVKRRARMGYVKSANAKVLELPVGTNGRFRMLFFYLLDKKDLATIVRKVQNNIINEMFDSLRESNVPLDVAIPRVEITGEVDMRAVLEDLGVKSLWTDQEATKYITTPTALPSSYVQRATITLNERGVTAPSESSPTLKSSSGLDPRVGTEFIANQPFLFSLFDADTRTPLVAVGYTKPTYR